MMKTGNKIIKILYDNNTLEGNLYSDWGISIFVDNGQKNILFDVGKDRDILTHNMDQLGVSKEDIDIIVISHRHWDHFGGLSVFEDQEIKIYTPESWTKMIEKEFDLAGELIPVSDRIEITDDVYSTGELGKAIKEQSLLIRGDDGIYILTGCGHPGLGKILKEASEVGAVKAIIGGYHGFDQLELLAELYRVEDIPMLVPCHCTVLLERIQQRYSEVYRECGVGFTLEI
ncbi:MAG: MBL fold metallo-hydrolase [Thermoplasmatota archaeon]